MLRCSSELPAEMQNLYQWCLGILVPALVLGRPSRLLPSLMSWVLSADLQEFGRLSLLHWIEALSLLGALDKLTARIQTRATGSDDSGYTN